MTLWEAAQANDLDAADAALSASPELVNEPSPDGWTALHLAAHFGHSNLVAWLLALGADPLARSRNALDNLPIHAAAAGRHAGAVQLLLDAGTPVDSVQHGGFTALHAVANSGDLGSLEVLLKAGADPHFAAQDGRTAFDFARAAGHESVLARLGR